MRPGVEAPRWLSHRHMRCSKLFSFVLFQFNFCLQGFLSQLQLTPCSDRSLMYSSWFEIKYLQQQQQIVLRSSCHTLRSTPSLSGRGCCWGSATERSERGLRMMHLDADFPVVPETGSHSLNELVPCPLRSRCQARECGGAVAR